MTCQRPYTAVDRMLAWVADAYLTEEPERRHHQRFGQVDVVVVERSGEPTKVFLANAEGVIVEATAGELLDAADFVRVLMAETLARNSP